MKRFFTEQLREKKEIIGGVRVLDLKPVDIRERRTTAERKKNWKTCREGKPRKKKRKIGQLEGSNHYERRRAPNKLEKSNLS